MSYYKYWIALQALEHSYTLILRFLWKATGAGNPARTFLTLIDANLRRRWPNTRQDKRRVLTVWWRRPLSAVWESDGLIERVYMCETQTADLSCPFTCPDKNWKINTLTFTNQTWKLNTSSSWPTQTFALVLIPRCSAQRSGGRPTGSPAEPLHTTRKSVNTKLLFFCPRVAQDGYKRFSLGLIRAALAFPD